MLGGRVEEWNIPEKPQVSTLPIAKREHAMTEHSVSQ